MRLVSVLALLSFLVVGATAFKVDEFSRTLMTDYENETDSNKKCALACTLESIGVYWACAARCIAKQADPKCITVECLAASMFFTVFRERVGYRHANPRTHSLLSSPSPITRVATAAAFDTPCLIHCNKTKVSEA